MIRKRFEDVADWLKTQTENLERNERQYKSAGAKTVRERLLEFGTASAKINVQADDLNLLSWRIVDPINVMANARPQVFQAALNAIWAHPLAPANADRFWSLLDPALDVLDPDRRKQFNGVGTRASVASYFLFVADHEHQPFYRPNFGGKAVNWLYDPREALTTKSPGALLDDYLHRCKYLHRSFLEAGVPLKDMLDTQGALYIIVDDYLKATPQRK